MAQELYKQYRGILNRIFVLFPLTLISDEFYWHPNINTNLKFENTNSDSSKIDPEIELISQDLKNLIDKFVNINSKDVNYDNLLIENSLKQIHLDICNLESYKNNPYFYIKYIGVFQQLIVNPKISSDEETISNLSRHLTCIVNYLSKINFTLHPIIGEKFITFWKETESSLKSKENLRKKSNDFEMLCSCIQRYVKLLLNTKIIEAKDNFTLKYKKETFTYIISDIAGSILDQTELEAKAYEILQAGSAEKKIATLEKDFKSFEDLSTYIEEKIAYIYNTNLDIPQISPQKPKIKKVPEYERPFRAYASYSYNRTAPSKSVFYINDESLEDYKDLNFLNLVISHEAVPGHHLLDTLRSESKSELIKSIENPYFYEGWAHLAESNSGIVNKESVEKFIKLRAARFLIDKKLNTEDNFHLEDAVSLLAKFIPSKEKALSEACRYQYTFGYQSSYFVGRLNMLKILSNRNTALNLYHLAQWGEQSFVNLNKLISKNL